MPDSGMLSGASGAACPPRTGVAGSPRTSSRSPSSSIPLDHALGSARVVTRRGLSPLTSSTRSEEPPSSTNMRVPSVFTRSGSSTPASWLFVSEWSGVDGAATRHRRRRRRVLRAHLGDRAGAREAGREAEVARQARRARPHVGHQLVAGRERVEPGVGGGGGLLGTGRQRGRPGQEGGGRRECGSPPCGDGRGDPHAASDASARRSVPHSREDERPPARPPRPAPRAPAAATRFGPSP